MNIMPWDQRIARVLVRPLVDSPVRPNQISVLTSILAIAGAVLLARGDPVSVNWGAGLFIFSRFLDHFDGELARQQGTTSKLGYYMDYVSGGISYAALFIGMGIGSFTGLGVGALILSAAGVASALISMYSNMEIDRHRHGSDNIDAVGYPGIAGFELEDGIYLLGPITWLGWLQSFFVAAGIGASVYCLWTILRHARLAIASR